jgi:hypothetical protein
MPRRLVHCRSLDRSVIWRDGFINLYSANSLHVR